MDEFYKIRRLPPYVFEQVNRLKASARAGGADIIRHRENGYLVSDVRAAEEVTKCIDEHLWLSPKKRRAMAECGWTTASGLTLDRHVDEELGLRRQLAQGFTELAHGVGVQLPDRTADGVVLTLFKLNVKHGHDATHGSGALPSPHARGARRQRLVPRP